VFLPFPLATPARTARHSLSKLWQAHRRRNSLLAALLPRRINLSPLTLIPREYLALVYYRLKGWI